MRFRIFVAASLLLTVAVPSFAATRNEAESAVKGSFRMTTTSLLGDFKEIGSVLTPRHEGLRAGRPSKAFKPNVIENRQLVSAGGWDLPLGKAHSGVLKPGERLYLLGVDSGDDYVQLDLFTVATYILTGIKGPTPLQASVRFHYDGGLAKVTSRQLLADIGEWLAVQGEPLPAAASPLPAAAPLPVNRGATVRLGQTPEEVTAILGPPEKQFLLGAKTIFVYHDVKVIFVDGKVVDAE